MSGIPSTSERTFPSVDRIIHSAQNLATETVPVEANFGPVREGTFLGQVTATGAWTPLKKSGVATAITSGNAAAATAVVVNNAAGFVAGNVVDIVDKADGTTENFSSKTILSVDYVTNTITFSAALGSATAIDVGDFVRLATVDGAEVPARLALEPTLQAEGAAATAVVADVKVIDTMIQGRAIAANVVDVSTFGILTAIGGTLEADGAVRIGF